MQEAGPVKAIQYQVHGGYRGNRLVDLPFGRVLLHVLAQPSRHP